MADATIDIQIRTKIRDIIAAADPTAVIFAWNVLPHDETQWPALFRTTAGVNGWMVARSGATADWKNNQRDRRKFSYAIVGFYGFRIGRDGDNSDDEFSQKIEAIHEGFRAAPTLNFDGTVERHLLPQFARIDTITAGEETLHLAQARLDVELCC